MEINYTTTLKRLTRYAFLFFLFLSLHIDLTAQISGNYTINSGSAASASNYLSFTAAINDLQGLSRGDGGPSNNTGAGVTGQVIFNVSANTYTEQITIPSITGVSYSKTINFVGAGASNTILTYAGTNANPHTVRLNACQYINFRKMTIANSTSSDGWIVHFMNASKCNISSCTIEFTGSAQSSSASNLACVVVNGSNTNMSSSSSNVDSLNIDTCILNYGFYNIYTYIGGGSSNAILQFRKDSFNNAYYAGMYFWLSGTFCHKVLYNTFSLRTGVSNQFAIWSWASAASSSSLYSEISYNKFTNLSGYGIATTYSGGNGGVTGRIYNNIFGGNTRGTTTYISGAGAACCAFNGWSIYNNTFYMDYTSGTSYGIDLGGNSSGSNVSIKNNIFYNPTNSANNIAINVPNSSAVGSIDYNNYYTNYTNGTLLSIGGTAYKSSNYQGTYPLGGGLNSSNRNINFNSSNDFHHNTSCLKGQSGLTGITIDLDGITRPNPPSMGAYEPTGIAASDIGVANILTPSYPVSLGSQPLKVLLKNYGTNNVSSIKVYYKLNNNAVDSETFNFNPALTVCDTASVTFTNNISLVGGSNVLKVYTALAGDVDQTNDTAQNTFCSAISGNFTINSSLAASSTNFQSFNAALSLLTCGGINGPVVFTVSGHTYYEQVSIPPINGSSSTNTITFVGSGTNSTFLTAAGTSSLPYTLRFNGCQYIHFRNMNISGSDPNYGWIVNILAANNNSVRSCKLEFISSAYSSTNSQLANVVINGSATSIGTTGSCHNNYIDSCNIISGYYGIASYAGSTSNINYFRNNTFTNAYMSSIYVPSSQCVKIINNNIQNRSNNSNSSGINLINSNANGSGGTQHEIKGNYINNVGTYGIYTQTANGGNGANLGEVYNNIIGGNFYSSGAVYGVSSTSGQYKYYNNTFVIANNTNTGSMCFYQQNVNNGNDIRNNIFAIISSTSNNLVPLQIDGSSTVSNLNNNIYYNTTGTTLLKIVGSAYTASTFNAAYPNGGGVNSYSFSPNFVSNSDYHITGVCNNGANLGVTTDIDNQSRAGIPDIGADESVTSPAKDAGVMYISSPSSPITTGSKPLKAVIKNYGSTTISSLSVSYSNNGGGLVTETFNFSPALNQCDTATITFATNITIVNGSNNVKMYTSLASDSFPSNDTINVSLCTQMSGAYTINPYVAASSTNFQSFTAAANQLNCGGISGAVTFTVSNGTYNESISLGSIIGNSSTNTITFTSASGNASQCILQGSSSLVYTIQMAGVDYVTFNNISFLTSTVGGARNIEFAGSSDRNTFNGCIFNSTQATSNYHVFEQSTVNNFNSFIGCTFNASGYGFYSNPNNRIQRPYFSNNIFNNQYNYAIYATQSDSLKVINNVFNASSASTYYGMYLINAGNAVQISGNKITGINNGYGIYFGGSVSGGGTTATRVKVYNNVIVCNSGSYNSYPIYMQSGNNIDVYHNTCYNQSSLTNTNCGAIYISSNSSLNIQNNIFYCVNGAYTLVSGSSNSLSNNTIDYNVYYTTGSNLVYWNGAVYTNLANWIANVNTQNNSAAGSAKSQLVNFVSEPSDLNLGDGCILGMNGTGITSDFNGLSRATIPNIGAYEYTSLSNNLAVIGIRAPSGTISTGLQNIVVTIKNVGNNTVSSGNISYKFDANAAVSSTLATSLNPCDTIQIVFSGAKQLNVTSGIHFLKVFTDSPNGVSDNNKNNDTLGKSLCTGGVSGNFTIDASLPSSTTNFQSFAAAVNAITSCGGISGPVYFSVAAGTYTGQVDLTNIAGLSATNTLTFDGGQGNAATRIVQASGNSSLPYTIRINNLNYITFKNLTVRGTSGNAWPVQLVGSVGCKFDTIKNCIIDFGSTPVSNFNSTNYMGIVLSGSATSYSTQGYFSNIYIDSNTINGGYTNIMVYSINVSADSNNVFTGNTCKNAYQYGMFLYGLNGSIIDRNKIDMNTNLTSSIGMYIGSCNALTSSNALSISRNSIINAGQYGLYLTSTSAFSTNRGNIINNLIGGGFRGSDPVGIYFQNSSYSWNVYHNSINLDNAATGTQGACIFFGNCCTTGSTVLNVRNNIMAVTNPNSTAYLFYMPNGFNYAVINKDSFNYNLYYYAGATSTSNIAYIAGTYLTPTNLINYSAYNANSVIGNPIFYSNTDLHVADPSFNMPIISSVSKDYDGTTRSATTDAGAYEMPSVTNDIGITAITAPVAPFAPGSKDITVTLKNFGNNTVTSANISYTVNGGSPITVAWTGSLASSATTSVTFTGANALTFAANTLYSIKAYTDSPNGSADGQIMNDTLAPVTMAAALCGSYTIDNNSAASLTNFVSFGSATTLLNVGGITCPAYFDVKQGTYNEQPILLNIAGASPTNTITFDGGSGNAATRILTYSATVSTSPYTFRLNGTKYTTLKNLTISSLNTNYGWTVHFKDAIACNVTKCIVKMDGAAATSTSGSLATILINGSNTNFSTNSTKTDSITIDSCSITGGYYGVAVYASQSSGKYFNIYNSTIDSSYYYGIFFQQGQFKVINNNIRMRRYNLPSSTGCYFANCTATNGNYLEFSNNTVTYAGTYGVFFSGVYNSNSTAVPANKFHNNMIGGGFSVTAGNAYAFFSASTFYPWDIYHNSFNMDANSTGGLRAFAMSSGTRIKIRNNIFAITGTTSGTGIPLEIGNSTFVDTLTHNDYYSSIPRPNLVQIGTTYITNTNVSTAYPSGGGTGSVNENPQFKSATNLHNRFNCMRGASTLGIAKDFDGETRNMPPNIGADELYDSNLVTDNIGVDAFLTPSAGFAFGSVPIRVRVKNFGKNTVTSFTVNYVVNGGSVVSQSVTGVTLNTCDTISILFNTSPTVNSCLSIYAYTTVPNGNSDNDPLNDGITQSFPFFIGGNYTIDPAGSGITNFVSFNEAAAFFACGIVNAPVYISVAAGTYNEQAAFTNILGTSSTNTITIDGINASNRIVTYTANSTKQYTLRFDNSSYITIKNLTIKSTDFNYGWTLHVKDAVNFKISNCNIQVAGSGSTSASGSLVPVVINGSNTNITTTSGINDQIYVDSCYISGGYYGIAASGQTSSIKFVYINNNTIDSSYYYGLYINNMPFKVRYNNISMRRLGSVNSYGGYFQSCYSNTNGYNLEFNNNKIINAGQYGVYFSTVILNGASTPQNTFYNNMIGGGFRATGANVCYAFYSNSNLYPWNFYHNTFNMDANTSGANRAFYVSGVYSSKNRIKNNIFVVSPSTATAAIPFEIAAGTSTSYFDSIGYNDYYSALAGNPTLGIMFGTNFNASSNLNTAFTSGGGGIGSVNINPKFTTATDLHITVTNLDGENLSGMIPKDIDLELHQTPPDMGADEYYFISKKDFAVTSLLAPATATCLGGYNQTIKVKIANLGNDTIVLTNDTAFVSAKVTDPLGGVVIYGPAKVTNQTFYPGDSIDVTITNAFDMSGYGTYTFRPYIYWQNDQNRLNDTLNNVTRVANMPIPSALVKNNTNICSNDSAKFSAKNSKNATTYQWYYNNSVMSSNTDSVLYAKLAGTYFCMISNASGCKAYTDTVTLNVKTAPSATFAVSKSAICSGDSSKLSITKVASCKYQWIYNGTNITNAKDSIYYAKNAGNYTLYVIDTVANCATLSSITSISISSSPTANITYIGNAKKCAGDSLKLSTNNASGLKYQWVLNGSNITGAKDSIYYAKATGTYKVIVTDSTTGCASTSSSLNFTINSNPTANITYIGNGFKCAGDSLKLSSNTSSGLKYQWALNGSSISGAIDSLFYVKNSGTYKVTITDSTTGCFTVSNNVTITIGNAQSNSITYIGNGKKCVGDSLKLSSNPSLGLKYQWTLNGTNINGAKDSIYYSKTTGTYKVVITDSATNCSSTSAGVTITFYTPPTASLTYVGSSNKCVGDSLKLSTNHSSGLTYQWVLNGSNIGGAKDSIYYAKTSGAYKVIITDTASGCGNTSSTVNITFNSLPTASISFVGSSNKCVGDSLKLSSNPASGLKYQWILNASNINGAKDSLYYAKTTGTYKVLVTDSASGCAVTSAGVNITFNNPPTAAITYIGNGKKCVGDSLKLSSNPNTGLSYQWVLNGSNIGSATDSLYYAKTTGNYQVIITQTSTGCKTTSSTVNITFNALPTAAISYIGSSSRCVGDSLKLSSNPASGLKYQWILNASNISGALDSLYFAKSTGSYKVMITDTTTGCSNTSSAVNITFNNPPTANVSFIGNGKKCTGDSLKLSSNPTSGLSYQWVLNGSNINGATDSIYYAKSAGTYKVIITQTSTTCNATSNSVNIIFNNSPTVTISYIGSPAKCAGDSLKMSSNPSSGLTYQWVLNGTNINGATDSIYYAKSTGNYKVIVTDTATGCATTSAVVGFTINANPTANVTYIGSSNKCAGDSLKLSSNPLSGLSYQWKLNGSDINAATDSIYYTNYTGTFSVYISNNTTGCNSTSNNVSITFNALPTTSISHVGTGAACVGDSIKLSSSSSSTAIKFQWSKNASNISGAKDSLLYVKTTGKYQLIITDTITGCSGASNTDSIIINTNPTSSITYIGNGIKCMGDSLKLSANATAGLTYRWFKNASLLSGASDSIYYVKTTGAYQVEVTNTNGCKTISTNANILIDSLPNTNISFAGNTQACGSDTVYITAISKPTYSYIWKESGNVIAGATTNTILVLANGSYTVTITNNNGCVNTSSPIDIKYKDKPTPPLLNGNKFSKLCSGDSIRISVSPLDTGVFSYKWKFNGNYISNANDSFIFIKNNGAYTAEVTNSNGCASESFNKVNLTVTAGSTSLITPSGSTTLCAGDSVDLSASNTTGISTLKWLLNGTGMNTIANPINVKQAGNYIAQIKDLNGCLTNSPSVTISVKPLPLPNITINNVTKEISTSSFTSYQWYLNNAIIPGANSQVYTPTQNGDYFVEVTDANGCKGKSVVRKITWFIGVNSIEDFSFINVYPNPSNGMFNIEMPKSAEVKMYNITDIAGREIYVNILQSDKNIYNLDLTSQAAGIYILRFSYNEQLYQIRLIKY